MFKIRLLDAITLADWVPDQSDFEQAFTGWEYTKTCSKSANARRVYGWDVVLMIFC